MTEAIAYKVNLENYYGPLDLLLHLVKETEVDVTAIALARVCEQYIGFLTATERLDIEVSGNFLSLASQLLLIKSRALAPARPAESDEDEEAEDEADASLELIRKLLDYKRFKDRSRMLDQAMVERARRHARPRLKLEEETEHEPLRNLELWDLVLLWSRVLKDTQLDSRMSILYHDVPLEVFIDAIMQTLTTKRSGGFAELVGDLTDRTKVLGTFLALLQLAKEQKVTINQAEDRGAIQVSLTDTEEPRHGGAEKVSDPQEESPDTTLDS